MTRPLRSNKWSGALLLLAFVPGAVGCAAKVNQDVFDREIAQIHEDMGHLDSRVTLHDEDISALSERLDGLQSDLEALRGEVDVTVTRLKASIRFATPVHFDFDRADIRTADESLLDRFGAVVGEHYEGAVVTIEGFADPAGAAAYNLHLSKRRAQAVADYVQASSGLPADMFRIVGYGETRQVRPGAQGPGAEGIENRRVAFVIEYAPPGAQSGNVASEESAESEPSPAT